MDDDKIKLTDTNSLKVTEDEFYNMILEFTEKVDFEPGETITLWTSFLATRAKRDLGLEIVRKAEEELEKSKDQQEFMGTFFDWLHLKVQTLEEDAESY